MKYILQASLCLLVSTVGFQVLAGAIPLKSSPCNLALQKLTGLGVPPAALKHAIKKLDEQSSRYLVMAELGPERKGELRIVDLQSQDVFKFAIQHGWPENKNFSVEPGKENTTHLGMMEIKANEDFKTSATIPAKATSPNLINKRQPQDFVACAGDIPKRNICLQPEDLKKLYGLLRTENKESKLPFGPRAAVFVYPHENLSKYLKGETLPNSESDVCKALAGRIQASAGNGLSGTTAAPPTGGLDNED